MATTERLIPVLLASVAGAWIVSAGLVSAQTAGSPAPLPPAPTSPALTTAGGVFNATNPDVVLTVRAGVAFSPTYLGSDSYQLGPDLSARIDYLRFPGGFEYGSSRTVGFRTGFGIRGSVRYIGERNSKDEIRGLDDVPWSFEAGLGVGYEQRNYRVFTDVRYGLVGHNAWVGQIGADGIAYPMDGLTVTLGPRLDFGDDKFTQTYFGVSNQESANTGGTIASFNASGGLVSAGVELGARYLFNDRWGVEGAASWNRLVNDAADSPITATGSEDQYGLRVGITRSISLDF